MSTGDPPERDPFEEKVFGLLTVAEDQQRAVQAAIGGLVTERAALARMQNELQVKIDTAAAMGSKLVDAVRAAAPHIAKEAGDAATAAVNAALKGVAVTTIQAAADAARPALESIAESVTAAAAGQWRIEQAQYRFAKQWRWIVAVAVMGMIAAGALVAYGITWYETSKIASLMQQREQLQTQLDALQGQVDQAKRAVGRRSKP